MTTLADLKTSVAGWCNRIGDTVFAANLPNFIALAEADIATNARAQAMVMRATYPITDQYSPLPCDWLEFLDVRVQGRPDPLPFASRLDPGCAPGGAPAVYRIVDGQLEVLPAQSPTAANPPILEIAYYARPQALVLDTDSTKLLNAHPAIYQFAAAMYGATFLEDDEATRRFGELAAAAIAKANEWQNVSRFSGARLNARARAF